MTTIDLADPRTRRAIPIAATHGQWAPVTNRYTGEVGYAIPASRTADLRYLVTATSCTCPDQTFNGGRECKHRIALKIWKALAS